MDTVLGESPFSVTDDKVSITEMRVHAVSGLTLSLRPSPGNSHTMVAKATGTQTLTAPKQVRRDPTPDHSCSLRGGSPLRSKVNVHLMQVFR